MKNKYIREEHVQKAKELLSKMTLREKIGQLNLKDYYAESDADAIKCGDLGNIFFVTGVELTNKLQKMAVEETRLGIPMLFGFDIIHGHRTTFPIPIATAASWDLDLIESCERVAAEESYSQGINWIYAPMVDLCREPRWGRIAEGAGEDPFLGASIAAARVRGFQTINPKTGYPYTAACFKHFCGYGLAEGGRDYDTTDISERTLFGEYLKTYQGAIDAGAMSTMSSFNCLNGEPVSGSYHYLTEVLRQRMGFEGFVVSDYNAIMELKNHRTAANDKDAAHIGILAGNDMDMTSGVYLRHLEELVKEDPHVMEKIDESVTRILSVKYALGLFEHPYRTGEEERELMQTPASLALARKAAAQSAVLLKNEDNTLPLKRGKTYFVTGPLADTREDNLGMWCTCGDAGDVVTPLEALKAQPGIEITFAHGCDYEGYDTKGFAEAVEKAKNADEILFFGGETRDWTGENHNKTHITIPDVQLMLLRELKKLGKKIIFVLMTGRPLAALEMDQLSDAVLCVWHAGHQAGNGICDVLFGDTAPCGKLPFTFPRYIGQIPVYYAQYSTGRPKKDYQRYIDSPAEPLYPFGYGLSYAKIRYSDINVTKDAIQATDTLHASVKVHNESDVGTYEVVQVYFRDVVSTYATPERKLCAFSKVWVDANSTVDVSFDIPASRFSMMTPKLEEIVEPGDFELYIGTDSTVTDFVRFRVV